MKSPFISINLDGPQPDSPAFEQVETDKGKTGNANVMFVNPEHILAITPHEAGCHIAFTIHPHPFFIRGYTAIQIYSRLFEV